MPASPAVAVAAMRQRVAPQSGRSSPGEMTVGAAEAAPTTWIIGSCFRAAIRVPRSVPAGAAGASLDGLEDRWGIRAADAQYRGGALLEPGERVIDDDVVARHLHLQLGDHRAAGGDQRRLDVG